MNVLDDLRDVTRFAKLVDEREVGPALEYVVDEAFRRGITQPIVIHVQELRLGPGDVLLVQYRSDVPQHVQEHLQRALSAVLGGAKALILDNTVDAVVAREGRA